MRVSPARALVSSLLLFSFPVSRAQLSIPSVLPGHWQYQGCWTDVPGRTLSDASYSSSTAMTIEACISFCSSRGLQYAGTEYSGECWCGSALASGTSQLADSDCNMACTGNASEPCGAGGKLSLFHTTDVLGPQPNPGVNGYVYMGCYAEGTTGRALTYGAGLSGSTLTVAGCTAACHAANYILAGVEYGGECYCGNTISNGGAPATSGCSMVCNGNSSEICGGPSRLDMYNYQNQYNPTPSSNVLVAVTSTSATPTPTGPSQPPVVGNYVWYGCQTEATNMRALSQATFAADTMTLEACQAYCSAYTYFGTEYARECYCGNSFNAGSVPAPATDCNFPCAGNGAEYCGAGNRLSVYAKNGTAIQSASTTSATASSTSAASASLPSGWTYQGCWIDGLQGRILQNQIPDSQTNTQESCAQACSAAGYSISGTEYSVQCFCGNAIYNGGSKTADSDCNMACPGNPSEMCGAGNRLTIFAKGVPQTYAPPAPQTGGLGSWTYQGCATDNINNQRTFFWQSFFRGNMTASMCLNRCAQYGYHAAGLEYGDECYCGDPANMATAGSTFRPESECSITCAGNASAICGGLSRLSTYFWTGTPLYSWDFPQDYRAGQYQFLVMGMNVPLLTMQAVTGKVSFISKGATGPGNETGAYELDLSTLTFRTLHVKTDVFCAGGVTLPDKVGRQMTVGGWAGDATYGTRLYWPNGSPGVPGTNDWQEDVTALHLQAGRWYPTAMIMANGSIMVIGGLIGSNDAATPSIEVLPYTGTKPLYMDWLDRTHPNNLYPFVCVLPGGGIFVQYWNEARILDAGTFATTKVLPNAPGAVNDDLGGRTYPLEGTAVLLPQKYPYTDPLGVLICGGSTIGVGNAIDNCVSIYPEAANPVWQIERMPSFRVMSCMAPLPDGTYLIANGAHHGVAGFGLGSNPNLNALLYDPSKPLGSRITVMANTTIARMYHSEAITLLDGRVLVSGSDPQDGVNPEEYRVEVFVPPYLLGGKPRPTFSLSSTDWAWGQKGIAFTLGAPAQNGAISATLLAAVSSTHGNSMGARTLMPNVACQGTACTVDAPPTANICPPGWYQFYVLDGGIPAVGVYVRIGGDVARLGNWPNATAFSIPGI